MVDFMHILTREELAEAIGCDPTDFRDHVTRYPTKTGQIFKLNTPIDTGEKSKAKYAAFVKDGWGLFPSLASARLWIHADTRYWAAT